MCFSIRSRTIKHNRTCFPCHNTHICLLCHELEGIVNGWNDILCWTPRRDITHTDTHAHTRANTHTDTHTHPHTRQLNYINRIFSLIWANIAVRDRGLTRGMCSTSLIQSGRLRRNHCMCNTHMCVLYTYTCVFLIYIYTFMSICVFYTYIYVFFIYIYVFFIYIHMCFIYIYVSVIYIYVTGARKGVYVKNLIQFVRLW